MSWVIKVVDHGDTLIGNAMIAGEVFSAGCIETDRMSDGRFWVARVYVRPEHRGKGLASDLLAHMCRRWDDLGVTAFLVPNPYDHTIDFKRLVALYERSGFVKTYNAQEECDEWVRCARQTRHVRVMQAVA